MSELKAFTFGLGQYTEDGSPCVVAFDGEKNPRLASDEKFYLKSEADKVIADLEESHKMEVGQLLMEIVKLKEERRWRKFPDEKPEEDVKVLVYTGRPGFMSIQIDVYTKEDGFSSTREPRFRTYGPYVTHWMPLPSAPKEDK